MKGIDISTSKTVVPKCYAYTTPTVADNQGWVKIGYTEQDDVETRINQQLKTAHVPHVTEWSDIAVFSDGVTYFRDDDFHAYLTKQGIERMKPLPGDKKPPEWFKISGDDSYTMYCKFRRDKGILKAMGTIPYTLRDEQHRAVEQTVDYFENHKNGEFLWNAKPRFGKTLAAYDLCKRLKTKKGKDQAFNVLIVTNRPAIANSWYDDYVKFLGDESGFVFVSETDSLKAKPYVLTREQFLDTVDKSPIEFLSLQDLKGSIHFGGEYDKLGEIKQICWDLLIVDEAHEGVDTTKTDVAFYQIKRNNTLHLSGTPFKALANDKFEEKAIFNWTYADEQKAKYEWDYCNGNNPYENLPKINLFTYKMSDIVFEKVKAGIEIDGENREFAFNLNDFFETNSKGNFIHEKEVDKFLEALTTQEKYPFSTPELRSKLKHTFWLLNRVDSAKALVKKLKEHPVFKDYEVVLAAGNGKLNVDDESKKAYDKVREAIDNNDKTITVSVGQLTTGITVPEWTAVLMLSNMKSPALYMQAAFRAQNPWKYQIGGQCFIKENAYVFDFDPARTLIIFEKFANDLSENTAGGKGGSDERKENVKELLNFFPVYGEEENGEMVELDAERVLSIPRKIRSVEVVRRGFMSNFLFQNISNIFNAPQEVMEIIKNFQPFAEKEPLPSREERESVSVNDEGEIELEDEYVIGKSKDIFGEKIYGEILNTMDTKTAEILDNSSETQIIKKLKDTFETELINPVMEITGKKYGDELKSKDEKLIRKQLKQKADKIITRETSNFTIQKNEIENKRKEALSNLSSSDKTEDEINNECDLLIKEATNNFKEKLSQTMDDTLHEITEDVVRTVDTKQKERQKESIEDSVRDHLRGFTRTIPSFLMAYGDENTTLENFDQIIPDEVFQEVTSISLKNFRFLRDGGIYHDKDTGEEKYYQGHLFDPVVFNDSVKEFLSLKKRLANYFDENNTEDIFDYIPPQKTNQIFTPKKIVKQMVDMLEEENPGCFDDSNKTFIDLYMKSGLFITEIVKRLYNSDSIKKEFPNSKERLNHIFEKQVYGLAPTKIIYRIALSFILGFDENADSRKHNFRMIDALPYAKEGTLEEKLDEIFKK